MTYLNQFHDVEMPPNQLLFCRLQMFFLYFATLSSNNLLIAVTFERFYSIIQPHKAASFNTVKRARIVIGCIFVVFIVYASPYLLITVTSGLVCVSNQNADANVLRELYYWLTEILIIIFPFLSLLTMNSVIIHTLRQRSKLKLLKSAGDDQSQDYNLKSKNAEKQIFTIILLITFVFLILNIPTRSLVFYLNFSNGSTPYYYAALHLFFQVEEATYISNHGINFFLYVISGQKFRTDLLSLFKTRDSKKRLDLMGSINTTSSAIS